MPTANTDASQLTLQRRAMAVYTNAVDAKVAINAGQSVRNFNTGNQSQEVVIEAKTGGCDCVNAGDYSSRVYRVGGGGGGAY
jgi:hypothetical protein